MRHTFIKTMIYRERNIENLIETLQSYSFRNTKLGFIKMFLFFFYTAGLIFKIIFYHYYGNQNFLDYFYSM